GLSKGAALRLPEPQQPGVARRAALADHVMAGAGLCAAGSPGARGSRPAGGPLRRLRRADGRGRVRACHGACLLRYELDDVPRRSRPGLFANDLVQPRCVEGARPPRWTTPLAVNPAESRRWFATDRALVRRGDATPRYSTRSTPPRLTRRDGRPPNHFPRKRLLRTSPGSLNQGFESGFANSNPQ